MNPNKVNELRLDPKLQNFYFYKGDDTSLEHLEAACAATADKVLVLADQKPNSSAEEKDFQSVLTCLAMDRINPEIYLITEIILPKFQLYLQHAKVEEVVYSSFNERALLCNIALNSGMYNLFRVLFDIHQGQLDIVLLPEEKEGKSYREVKSVLKDRLVIGLLENVGNLTRRKQEKLKQVQQLPSIKKAIQGLRELKEMESNMPVLHPPPNYQIKSNSALIVLKSPPNGLNQVYDTYGASNLALSETKQLIEFNLQETLLQSSSWREYFGLLATNSIKLLVDEGTIHSVQSGREIYKLSELEVDEELTKEIVQAYLAEIHAEDETIQAFHPTPEAFLSGSRNKVKLRSHALEADKKGRLFILGWKPELPEMLHFLIIQQFVNSTVEWKDITVVANLEEAFFISMQEQFANFDNIRLFRGDVADHDVLKMAQIETATKVLILAETASKKSFNEIDAQTVLATMMVSELNKRAYKVAEILDKRYETTLAHSKVEEIIALDEFSRRLLALGSHGKGITNVLKEFINLERTVVSFIDIPQQFVGQSMSTLYQAHTVPGIMVLGILEEAGNMYVRKSEKIRQAQFNPQIQTAVEELARVKELNPNQVRIAPPPDHLIPSNSRLILLHSSDHRGWEDYLEASDN